MLSRGAGDSVLVLALILILILILNFTFSDVVGRR